MNTTEAIKATIEIQKQMKDILDRVTKLEEGTKKTNQKLGTFLDEMEKK